MKTHLGVTTALVYFLLTASFMVSVAAHAEGPEVFGLRLGQPPTIPECRLKKEYNLYDYGPTNDREKQAAINAQRKQDQDAAAADAKTICYLKGKYEASENAYELTFPREQAPSMLQYLQFKGRVHIVLMEGNVEAVYFHTDGIRVRDSVLAELVKKFGKPSTINGKPVGNWMGARFSQIDAFWKLKGCSVSFVGAGPNSLSTGSVHVLTKKYLDNFEKEEKEKENKRVKM